MDQVSTKPQNLEEKLLSLRVGEQIVYGHMTPLGSSDIKFSVGVLLQKLESEATIQRFKRRSAARNVFELVAVGSTPSIVQRIAQGVKRYEEKMGLPQKPPRFMG